MELTKTQTILERVYNAESKDKAKAYISKLRKSEQISKDDFQTLSKVIDNRSYSNEN